MTEKKLTPLTPLEQTATEERAYKAWLAKKAIYSPPPQPDTTDLVHENPAIVRAMTGAVALLPVLLAVIGLAAVVISSDKTMWAFHASVANKTALWGAWGVVVALLAVVMVELGMVFAEFGKVRDMLKKNLHRRVWNIKDVWRAVLVRLGRAEPLDYTEMPDGTLAFYSRFMFLLVVLANTYGVMHAYTSGGRELTNLTATEYLELGLFMVVGLAGAFSLRLIGAQLAHMVYELMDERRTQATRELYEEWRTAMMQAWANEGPALIEQALHDRFITKNKLPLDAESPYLLTAGVTKEGMAALDAVPFDSSWPPSPRPLPKPSSNGSQESPR